MSPQNNAFSLLKAILAFVIFIFCNNDLYKKDDDGYVR